MMRSLALLLLGPALLSAETVLHVSPEGSDRSAGSRAAPLATVDGARLRLRELRTAGATGPFVVQLSAGVYRMRRAAEFSPEDGGSAESPVTYRAVGGPAILDGGAAVSGWRVLPDGDWEARLSDLGGVDALWVDGRRATPAREPDGEWGALPGPPSETEAALPDTESWRRPWREQSLRLPPAEAALLAQLGSEELAEARLTVVHSWAVSRRRLTGFDSAAGVARMRGKSVTAGNPWKAGQPFILEGVAAGLDTPGEWHLSRLGLLRYRPLPGQDPTKVVAVVPVADRLLRIKGDLASGRRVEHLSFEGLAFRHTGGGWHESALQAGQSAYSMGAVIEVEAASAIRLDRCSVAHTGLWAVWLRLGCEDVRVTRTRMSDLGGGGVQVGAGPYNHITPETRRWHPRRNEVSDCIITQAGRVNPEAAGVLVCHAADNLVAHNEIADLHYTGVSVGWAWGYHESLSVRNRIESNHIHHIGQSRLMNDLGGIYTLGVSPGTVIRRNHIHHVTSRSAYGWGLYTDEGSSGILLEENVVRHAKSSGFFQHYGRENVVRNNIFYRNGAQQVECSYRPEPHESFRLERNILVWEKGSRALGGPSWAKLNYRASGNLLFAQGDEATVLGRPASEWLAHRDPAGKVGDPLFVDAEAGDFRLREGSPALALGFKSFDIRESGVRGEPEWRRLAADSAAGRAPGCGY